ncbi:GNAT family N-acetyltransferase [Mangrovimonas sp. YM274]|uniref:GNAT family N-acetyltransferase n=1 Tax=Mangrovimonas sp. YM274 TaxID=3070660 RepID=UPI0027DACD55|nr:GNAT family N-acetyltransferase [Mangrovimonas sp. YM274]WMI69120.1 GNAT family N-acetyltransferase [Mangrovimonas sp. YM274]
MIRKASIEDLKPLISLTKACTQHMRANGIYQWNDTYPNKTCFQIDIQRGELFVYERENKICACVARNHVKDEVYNAVSWLTKDCNNLYIHRLAVHPTYQGQGIAQQLMEAMENYAKINGFNSIRLDTFSLNKRNQKFYELRGYKQLEAIYFPNQSEHPFYCYELIL